MIRVRVNQVIPNVRLKIFVCNSSASGCNDENYTRGRGRGR